MSKGVKLLAALMEDEGTNGQELLKATKNLACAVSDLLKTAQPATAEVDIYQFIPSIELHNYGIPI